MITRKEFDENEFERIRNSKKQEAILELLSEDKEIAYTTKEIALKIHGDETPNSISKVYYILIRLFKKGIVDKKAPYWIIKK